MKRDKHLGFSVDSKFHEKLKYIAKYDGRSLRGQFRPEAPSALQDE